MSCLTAALFYSNDLSWHIFPSPPGTRASYKSQEQYETPWGATNDPRDVWRDWLHWPAANIGIPTGKQNGFFVVDIDTARGHVANGFIALAKLEIEHGALPDTLQAISPSGSLHYYFEYPDNTEIRNSASKLGPGIDIRGEGGMVIGPPSRKASGEHYRWHNVAAIARAPAWLLDMIKEPEAPTLHYINNNTAPATTEKIEYALNLISPDCNYDDWRNILFALYHELGEQGRHLAEAWSARSPNKYTAKDFKLQWAGIMKHKKPHRPITINTLFHLAQQASPGWTSDYEARRFITKFIKPKGQAMSNIEEILNLMTEKYSVVIDGNKTQVFYFDEGVPKFLSFADFRAFFKNKKIAIAHDYANGNQKTIYKPIADAWLDQGARPTYDGLCFEPTLGEVVGNKINLWRGWPVEPAPGDWRLIRQHLKEVISKGHSDRENYVLNWLAWMVQHPDKQAGVALVLKGTRGSGKGTLGNALITLLGRHATHIKSHLHLTGRFNSYMRDCIFLFADEAYWGGLKSEEGALQGLITEPLLTVEPKGKDIFMVKNMLHILMATNNDWVVPAGARERRFQVFEVSDERVGDRDYFKKLYAEINGGGVAAMLHDLLRRELGDWNPTHIIHTEELMEQQVYSLKPEAQAWIEFLEHGYLPHSAMGFDGDYTKPKPDKITSKELYAAMRDLSPQLKRKCDRDLAEYIKKMGGLTWHQAKARGWQFPSLRECREIWLKDHPTWKFTNRGDWGAIETTKAKTLEDTCA